jgi:hypothetical protein
MRDCHFFRDSGERIVGATGVRIGSRSECAAGRWTGRDGEMGSSTAGPAEMVRWGGLVNCSPHQLGGSNWQVSTNYNVVAIQDSRTVFGRLHYNSTY